MLNYFKGRLFQATLCFSMNIATYILTDRFVFSFFAIFLRNQILLNLMIAVVFYSEKAINANPLQYSCLENSMDRGAWQAAVHGVTKSRAQLSHFTFTFYFHALEKEMATHFSILAWRIPGTEEPNGLPSMGSHRVGHD